MTPREQVIDQFLLGCGHSVRRKVLAEDASFRRYWRLGDGGVLMDAPPEAEDVRPFLRLQAHLAAAGLSVPKVFAADPSLGLVVLEDLGDDLFPAVMNEVSAEALYDAAVDALVTLHSAPAPPAVPRWAAEEMCAAAEATFLGWWWPAQFGAPADAAVEAAFRTAMAEMLLTVEAGALVHRDYFAGNLFWLPERDGVRRVGIIDFQDAALGHPAYDLVSLVEDARRVLPDGLAERQLARYLTMRPEVDGARFRAAYEACAAQRHLRVAALWVRLARRDGKPHYLQYGALTWARLERALARPGAASLRRFMDRFVASEFRGTPAGLTSA